MENVEIKQLLNKISTNYELLSALEQELADLDLLEEVYQGLYYQIDDVTVRNKVNLYKDDKTGRVYNRYQLSKMPDLNVTKHRVYNIVENITLYFNDYIVATEQKLKPVPASNYDSTKVSRVVPLAETGRSFSLSGLIRIYPELFVVLVAHYDIDLTTLKTISKGRCGYQKEIKKN